MGTRSNARSDRPSRPHFKWDMRKCPWTNRKGNQEQYVINVRRWCRCHDSLPENNSNRIRQELRRLTLQAQLYDCAVDLCSGIREDVIASD